MQIKTVKWFDKGDKGPGVYHMNFRLAGGGIDYHSSALITVTDWVPTDPPAVGPNNPVYLYTQTSTSRRLWASSVHTYPDDGVNAGGVDFNVHVECDDPNDVVRGILVTIVFFTPAAGEYFASIPASWYE
ncbi:hypothetical protein ACFXG4_48220 [Nocardia sp. NPDC059246]|uniref:hypothetical protein n=1 Tax=unclassified Nocardia TaxID=2637762 RepID=UPI0036C0F8A7